ncbi:MAG TPA: hypothetical protein P5127_05565, partial [Oscillospiraceae bacterium]|nr:hypothetical protein [Oscillospiraceae bacterium]
EKLFRISGLVSLLFAVIFVTWFGALKVPYEDDPASFYPPFVRTASVIAMHHKVLYLVWVGLVIISLLLNVRYIYSKYDFKSKFGTAFLYLSFVSLIITIIVPHAEGGIEKLIHWSGALSFGVFCAGSVIIFLFKKGKENKKFTYTMFFFIGVLALMLILLALFKENGAIETLPIWCAYIILFLANYTPVYKK